MGSLFKLLGLMAKNPREINNLLKAFKLIKEEGKARFKTFEADLQNASDEELLAIIKKTEPEITPIDEKQVREDLIKKRLLGKYDFLRSENSVPLSWITEKLADEGNLVNFITRLGAASKTLQKRGYSKAEIKEIVEKSHKEKMKNKQ